MKCRKCNSKITGNDFFCPECGIRVKENKIMRFINNNYKKIVTLLSTIVVIIVLFNIINYLFSPKYIANKYIKAVLNNNYEDIYKLSGLTDSKLVSTKILKEKIDKMDIDEYKYDGIEENGDTIYVRYIYSKNNKKYTIYIELVKQINKKYLLFDNYKIVSGKVATDIKFTFPKNSKVKIDDIDISSYLVNTDEYDNYEIDKMIKGQYEINIILPNGIEINKKVDVESDNTYSIGEFDIDDNLKNTLIEKIGNALNNLYNSAINNIDYNESNLTNLKEEYKTLKNYIQLNNKLVNIKFSDIDVKSVTYENNLVVTFNIGCNYSINNGTEIYDGLGYTNIEVEFTYNDGNYGIKSISQLPTSFRKIN